MQAVVYPFCFSIEAIVLRVVGIMGREYPYNTPLLRLERQLYLPVIIP